MKFKLTSNTVPSSKKKKKCRL